MSSRENFLNIRLLVSNNQDQSTTGIHTCSYLVSYCGFVVITIVYCVGFLSLSLHDINFSLLIGYRKTVKLLFVLWGIENL